MTASVEVFTCYMVYVLLFSLCHSSEESVLLGRGEAGVLGRLEASFVSAFGCVVPYLCVYFQTMHGESLVGTVCLVGELVLYAAIKDSVVVYIKRLNLFLSRTAKLSVNPSGHTFMFLNSIFILMPVVHRGLKRKSPFVLGPFFIIYKYNRMLCDTVLYYHTFCDVALGVVFFCLFRSFVVPLRRGYEESCRYEWGSKRYLQFAAGVLCAVGGAQIFLWLRENLEALSL
ncbi:hypothetical protein NECID01_0428 [Nematocida sp. AWRm77]|nr:hypothetical protein NECID01_0428 [Nematocida sp. AWRm77]